MTGVAFMLRTRLTTHRRILIVWTLVLVGSLAFTALSVAALYDTPEKIQTYGQAVVSDALVAINGRVEGIDSLGGIIADEFGFMASFLMPVAGIACMASMTRAEEASGRMEALLSGSIDRRCPVVAALVLVTGAGVVMVTGFVVSLVAAGIDPAAAALYSLSLGLLMLFFAALSAVLAQVVGHSRGVYAGGLAVVALAYVLRGIGDVRHTFWVWLSPLGWLEKTAPFAAAQRWWVLLIPTCVTTGLTLLAIALAGRRDLGSAMIHQPPGDERASRWLVQPIGLAVHRQRGSFLGWAIGSLILAAVMGALAQELIDAITANSTLSSATGITADDAMHGFLAFTQVYLALIACGYLVQGFGSLRREETADRLEPMLTGRVGRTGWLAAQLITILTGLLVMVTTSAIALSIATALSTRAANDAGTALEAGLGYVPAELVVAGAAVLVFGAAPRAYALVWGAFGAITFLALLGSGLQLPPWLLDLSPLSHVGYPPVDAARPLALAVLTFLAAALTTSAFIAFRRRRVPVA